MEKKSKDPKIYKDSLAINILKKIALGGLVLIAASNPYFGLGLIKGIKKHHDKKTWRKFYASLRYLDRRSYVRILKDNGENLKVKITQLGEDIIERVNIETIKLPRPDEWDDKWRVVIFDVPNTRSRSRLAFTEKLKELGFIMVQKSVWAYPYECRKEVAILRKFYGIEKCVSYLETTDVEDGLDWRGKFNFIVQSP